VRLNNSRITKSAPEQEMLRGCFYVQAVKKHHANTIYPLLYIQPEKSIIYITSSHPPCIFTSKEKSLHRAVGGMYYVFRK